MIIIILSKKGVLRSRNQDFADICQCADMHIFFRLVIAGIFGRELFIFQTLGRFWFPFFLCVSLQIFLVTFFCVPLKIQRIDGFTFFVFFVWQFLIFFRWIFYIEYFFRWIIKFFRWIFYTPCSSFFCFSPLAVDTVQHGISFAKPGFCVWASDPISWGCVPNRDFWVPSGPKNPSRIPTCFKKVACFDISN